MKMARVKEHFPREKFDLLEKEKKEKSSKSVIKIPLNYYNQEDKIEDEMEKNICREGREMLSDNTSIVVRSSHNLVLVRNFSISRIQPFILQPKYPLYYSINSSLISTTQTPAMRKMRRELQSCLLKRKKTLTVEIYNTELLSMQKAQLIFTKQSMEIHVLESHFRETFCYEKQDSIFAHAFNPWAFVVRSRLQDKARLCAAQDQFSRDLICNLYAVHQKKKELENQSFDLEYHYKIFCTKKRKYKEKKNDYRSWLYIVLERLAEKQESVYEFPLEFDSQDIRTHYTERARENEHSVVLLNSFSEYASVAKIFLDNSFFIICSRFLHIRRKFNPYANMIVDNNDDLSIRFYLDEQSFVDLVLPNKQECERLIKNFMKKKLRIIDGENFNYNFNINTEKEIITKSQKCLLMKNQKNIQKNIQKNQNENIQENIDKSILKNSTTTSSRAEKELFQNSICTFPKTRKKTQKIFSNLFVNKFHCKMITTIGKFPGWVATFPSHFEIYTQNNMLSLPYSVLTITKQKSKKTTILEIDSNNHVEIEFPTQNETAMFCKNFCKNKNREIGNFTNKECEFFDILIMSSHGNEICKATFIFSQFRLSLSIPLFQMVFYFPHQFNILFDKKRTIRIQIDPEIPLIFLRFKSIKKRDEFLSNIKESKQIGWKNEALDSSPAELDQPYIFEVEFSLGNKKNKGRIILDSDKIIINNPRVENVLIRPIGSGRLFIAKRSVLTCRISFLSLKKKNFFEFAFKNDSDRDLFISTFQKLHQKSTREDLWLPKHRFYPSIMTSISENF
eukprot:Anaeramoba_ignava/a610865_32.p1 GENE.a610865_32~~a610865_32.p1  ORF type:complete len:791 (-),score=225.88 a610865_32:26-2398(-)